MPTFGIGLVLEHEPERLLNIARMCEEYGIEKLWLADERFFRDVWGTIGFLAARTKRIEFGTSVTDPFVRHPALTANAIASLDEWSGGRCNLGIGAGISGFAAMGVQRLRPAVAIKEAVQLMRQLWDGGRTDFHGQMVNFNDSRLDWRPQRRVPVYVAGRAPKILEVGGELGDGVVIGSFASEGGIAYAKSCIEKGARKAGRTMDDIKLVSWLYTSVSPDSVSAKEAVRPGVSTAIWGSREVLDKIGIDLPADYLAFMDQHSYTQDPDIMGEAARMVPPNVLADFCVAGNADECADKLVQLAGMGIGHMAMWVFPPANGSVEQVIQALAENVIPKVRARCTA